MEIKAEFYCWHGGPVNVDPFPYWITKAIEDGTIVNDGDGDGFLVTTAGRMRIEPGAYLMYSVGTIFLIDAMVYEAMAAADPPGKVTPPAPISTPLDLDAPNGLGDPPYSSAVLARSARARMLQTEWENRPVENAAVEGDDGTSVQTPR